MVPLECYTARVPPVIALPATTDRPLPVGELVHTIFIPSIDMLPKVVKYCVGEPEHRTSTHAIDRGYSQGTSPFASRQAQ